MSLDMEVYPTERQAPERGTLVLLVCVTVPVGQSRPSLHRREVRTQGGADEGRGTEAGCREPQTQCSDPGLVRQSCHHL